MKRHITFISSISALILMTLACSFSIELGGSLDAEIINVEAREGWNNTHIEVEEGDLLTITYVSGEWSPWPGDKFDAIGSGGDPRCRCNVMEGWSVNATIIPSARAAFSTSELMMLIYMTIRDICK